VLGEGASLLVTALEVGHFVVELAELAEVFVGFLDIPAVDEREKSG
jgi:hypothetical protein